MHRERGAVQTRADALKRGAGTVAVAVRRSLGALALGAPLAAAACGAASRGHRCRWLQRMVTGTAGHTVTKGEDTNKGAGEGGR